MPDRRIRYSLDDRKRFVVEDYNWAIPFSNFFPGIAGLWGIPLWIYYVSRGQAVCSMGVRDKDHQILEFQSFNRACQAVPDEGFRTFIRLGDGSVHEPFVRTERVEVEQSLAISAGEVELCERDPATGLTTTVVYFPLVNLPVAGLVRQVTLKNESKAPIELECLDGVPRVLPYGMNQQHIKFTARHIEAMMGVQHHRGVPLFRLKQTASDRERVDKLSGGNFYLTVQGGELCDGRFIVDPEVVFGDPFQHHRAWAFERGGAQALLAARQLTENATPCAFTALSGRLEPGQAMSWTSVLGNVADDAELERFLTLATRAGALEDKRSGNRDEIESITDMAFTASAENRFDQYCGQDFLDNVMRGGLPVVFDGGNKQSVFYVYARQNGDLERDYHYFVLEPTYLSQGTGHYRSIYQNRRTDTWFYPEIQDANIRWFMNLIQLDGYNPLEVRGLTYSVRDREEVDRVLGELAAGPALDKLVEVTRRPFTPGELVMAFEHGQRKSPERYFELVGRVLAACDENEIGGLHEGFWVDHWLYNLDTIDVYLMVFPDQLRELLVERNDYTFFDDPDVILPRSEKSVRRDDGAVRRYGAVVRDPEKRAALESRKANAFQVRTKHGQGEVYRTSLLVKLLCLVANRMATLDPAGVGMDMEADKPGWNDSMNGLPGLFGSSLCETLELEKACRSLDGYLERLGDVSVPVYEELVELVDALTPALDAYGGHRERALCYWEAANAAKERYRAATKLGVSGAEKRLDAARLRGFLARCLGALAPLFDGTRKSEVLDESGVPFTYFVNEVTASDDTGQTSHQGLPLVVPTEFEQRPVPLFLEGPVHYMKVHPDQAKDVYEAVRKSDLFDSKLGMYRSCVDMSHESFELGRAVGAYPRGWLENESIYLHMEYKYLLEILRAGLYEEFYRDIKTVLVPFHDPAVYGRSTLEGASFIVSSSYADPSLHGRGFQPRLSGITCEMLHAWILMVAGEHPFRLDADGNLQLALEPALPGWLFTDKASVVPYHDPVRGRLEVEIPASSFAFKLLGKTLVTYRNEARLDTWGKKGAKPVRYAFTFHDGNKRVVEGSSVDGELARAVRDGQVAELVVTLAGD
jgi:hypothetical protein